MANAGDSRCVLSSGGQYFHDLCYQPDYYGNYVITVQ